MKYSINDLMIILETTKNGVYDILFEVDSFHKINKTANGKYIVESTDLDIILSYKETRDFFGEPELAINHFILENEILNNEISKPYWLRFIRGYKFD